MKDTAANLTLVAREICGAVENFVPAQVLALENAILQADRVFVGGAGRSLLMARAFAMRLMHLGLQAHVVGETITPSIERGDLLIVASGSGETRTTLAMAEAATSRGARTAAITAHADSPIARACDLVVEVPAQIVGISNQAVSHQPPGSLFEQCLLVLAEAMVLSLMERLGTTYEQMRGRHTKLE